MATSKEITNLVINKVESQTVYDYMVDNNLVNDDELYLIESDSSELEVVMYTAQELTDEQKAQARANIDAIDSVQVNDELNGAVSPINYTRIELPSAQTWCTRGPFYANGRFIIPSRSGVIAYSDDGINWSDAVIDSGFVMIEACYGNGMYIATDDFDHCIHYSEDGISWSKTADIGFYPGAIGYGNGVFVALSSREKLAAYSTDGIYWTQTTSPCIATWSDIAYGDGKFVAIAHDDEGLSYSHTMIYSEDGITWQQKGFTTGYYGSIAYGNGKFVVKSTKSKGSDYNFFLCSEDGMSWTKVKLDYPEGWDGSVTFCGDRFINISNDNSLKYSYDGISWTIVQIPNNLGTRRYAYGDGKFIGTMTSGIGSSGNEAYCFTLGNKFGIVFNHELEECKEDLMSYANNRMSLEQVGTILPIDGVDEVAFGDGKYVAARYDDSDAAYSLDGIIWDKIDIGQGRCNSIAYGNGKFVAMSTTGKYAYSSDGINWTIKSAPSTDAYYVTYGNGKFIALSLESIFYSTDGIEWVETHTNSSFPCYSAVAYGNNMFVAVSEYSGFISTSVDGITWNDNDSFAVDTFYCVVYGSDKFVILPYSSNNTTGYYSSDASTWNEMTIPSGYWKHIKYGNGMFVATGLSSQIIYSNDGINWNSVTLPQAVTALEYANGQFIALGNSNKYVFTSVDGIEWTMLMKDDVLQDNESVTARVSESIYQTSVAMHKESYLPSATSDNDGQFLRVVNGIPTWTTIPSAEEASF